jgi:phosphate transport system substrate-binding protein
MLILISISFVFFQECRTAYAGSETITISGTGSSIGVMNHLADAFCKKHPEISIKILPSIGSTGGIRAVKEKKIDIGLSSRAIKPDERDPELIEEAYGRTPFVFAAHNNIREKNITLGEVEKIYLGQLQAWPDKTPIRLVLRPKSDAYTVYLAGINNKLKIATEKSYGIPGLFTGITDLDAADQIEKTPGAFGVTSLSLIAAEHRNIKALSVDGVLPTVGNLESGKYPYSMTMYIIYRKNNLNDQNRKFIEFIYSKDGQKILRECGHKTITRKSAK